MHKICFTSNSTELSTTPCTDKYMDGTGTFSKPKMDRRDIARGLLAVAHLTPHCQMFLHAMATKVAVAHACDGNAEVHVGRRD
jgi:hypothetical protein